jgi:hypothetical protein
MLLNYELLDDGVVNGWNWSVILGQEALFGFRHGRWSKC